MQGGLYVIESLQQSPGHASASSGDHMKAQTMHFAAIQSAN